MPNSKPLYYWDTCIWIAWIMNEARSNREMDGVVEVVELVGKNQASIIVSDCISTEILTGKWPADGARKFEDLFKRRNVKRVPISPNITTMTQQIREFYHNKGEKTVSPLDAVHLATAIVYKVDQMHTFDDGKKDKKSRSLLDLNGNVAGLPLVICKPPATQYRLI
jgi:predicted nucleic acid-binding protein